MCMHVYTHIHTCTRVHTLHTCTHMHTHTQQSGWRGPHLARPLRCPRGGWQDGRGRQEAEGTPSPRYLRARLQFNSTHQSVTLHQGLQLVHTVASQGNLVSDGDRHLLVCQTTFGSSSYGDPNTPRREQICPQFSMALHLKAKLTLAWC